MTNSEARKRAEEAAEAAQSINIAKAVLDGESDSLHLEMSAGDALVAVGDLMHAALQLLAQAIAYMSQGNDNAQGETA